MALLNQRYRPTSYTKQIVNEEFGIECFYQTVPECCAILYQGKSAKKVFHFKFANEERMMKFVEEKINNIVANKTSDRNRRNNAKLLTAEMKASDHFKMGDIVINTWGFDQTNVEFYQVIEVLNKKIRVREVYQLTEKGSEYSHGMACNVSADKDNFIEKEKPFLLSLKMDEKGECWICNPESFYYFHKWSGRPNYKSWYA